jgi:hypothetical protein
LPFGDLNEAQLEVVEDFFEEMALLLGAVAFGLDPE